MSNPACAPFFYTSTFDCSSKLSCVNLMKPYTTACILDYLNDQRAEENASVQMNDLHVSSPPTTLNSSEQCNGMDLPSKKRVSFADSVGLELVHIRHMTAGRDTPPDLDPQIFISLGQSNEKSRTPSLQPVFSQPIANFSQFMQSLERNNVQVESVVVKDSLIIGTVKVKNLAFYKTVFVRVTRDHWRSSYDVSAHFVNNGLCKPADLSTSTDTFSFTIDIPLNEVAQVGIEFAVCYRCNGQEFWDNNGNKNYCFKLKDDDDSSVGCEQPWKLPPANQTNWTEFAIWRGLESNHTPYW
ncbi:protein phosphatase 1 regulatory subunit 3B-like [Watersipora subatra]|uniref:protein phosphatase 1 regulatory subunit 3B-like n=1 Tax=Watersipora subatra TaxID=2589382 RepID=UPI00355B5F37